MHFSFTSEAWCFRCRKTMLRVALVLQWFGFNEKIQRRFNKLQDEINRVEDDMIRGYVLKQDFIREMDVVHQKLDRILELMIKQNSK